jgi:hypothetical protein
MGPQTARGRSARGDIEYAVVALGLSAMEIAAIIKDATDVTVEPKAGKFFQAFNASQLESIWNRISESPRWRKA